MLSKSVLARLVVSAALAASLGACTVRGHARFSTPGVVYVDEAPPPPRHEVVVVRPGYVWVDGNWNRRGNNWVWVSGHHERTRANAAWQQGRWERRGNRHVYVKGTWKSHKTNKPNRGRSRVQDHR